MSTYGTLVNDVAGWLIRADLVDQIPSFVRLAENDIANDVRIRDMVRRARAAGADSRYLALPTGYLDMRRLEIWPDSDRHYSLVQVTPENLQILNLRDTSASSYNYAQRYTVHREIEFDAPIDASSQIEMIYYRRYDPLSDDADTNLLLANDYGCYLYGALKHAEPYLRNDERVGTWASLYREAVGKAMRTEMDSRVNRAEARVSISGATP